MRPAVSNPFFGFGKRPIVVGHRGVPRLHQENTLAGFRRAVSLGVPAVELDVRLTADGRAVVLHDSDLKRLTGTAGSVIDMTWDQVSRLRLRREIPMGVDAHHRPVVGRYEQTERIPQLAEVLSEITVAINIELKLEPPRWGRVDIGAVVAKAIAEARAEDRVIVTSFDPRKLRAVGRARPGLAIGFCFDDGMLNFARGLLDRLPRVPAAIVADRRPGHNGRHLLSRVLDTDLVGRLLKTRVVGAEHTLVAADTVRRLHAQGVAIGTHTLFPFGSPTNKPVVERASTVAEVERVVATGVDWIETDDPERLLAMIG